jgi:hypothetical protein
MMRISLDHSCNVPGFGEYDMKVEIEYHSGRPGRWYMPNGDPGYPPEPDEIEILDVLVDGKPLEGIERETVIDFLQDDENLWHLAGQMAGDIEAAKYEPITEE